jgi:hypothetical protein
MQTIYKQKVAVLIPRQKETDKMGYWKNGTILENSLAGFFGESGPPLGPTPLRLYIIMWLFLCIIISCAYNSKLYLALAFPPVQYQPKNFDELVKSEYSWGIDYLGAAARQTRACRLCTYPVTIFRSRKSADMPHSLVPLC